LPVAVVATRRAWPDTGRARRAGVSSFGVSGTNAHVIVEEAPAGFAAAELPRPKRPLRGERHWGPPRPADTASSDWLYAVQWRECPRRERAVSPVPFAPPARAAEAVETWLRDPANAFASPAYAAVLPALEKIAAGYARLAVKAIGGAGARDVAAPHRRLFARLEELAARADAEIDPAAAIGRLQAAVPEAVAETTLLARCGAQLADVVRGRVDPLTLLFPPGERLTAASLYQETPTARAVNELVRVALASALPAGRTLRVLEIGAGTGGTTAAVLPALPAEGVEYVFTDVSPLFLTQARARYRDRPWIRPQLLDLERDPLAQGFAPGEFDVVIAANVLHATRDVRGALRHARSLLAGGGVLVLLEATAPLGLLDLIFGLTDGWWRFADADLRPAHALLSPARWREALAATGFADPAVHTFPARAGEIFTQQSVLTARAAGETRRSTADADGGDWLIVTDDAQAVAALAAELTGAGARWQLAGPDENFADRLASLPVWRGVVHAVGLGAGDPLAEAPLRSALALAQALVARPAPWFLLTREAMAVAADDSVAGFGAAGLWGLARTVAQEHPELRPRCIDFSANVNAAALAAELLRPGDEDQIAWRGGRRWVARLEHRAVPAAAGQGRVTADGTYLIVGGLGGLGVPLARWLIERGARHLVLAGRRAPDDETQRALAALAATGAEVRVEQLDVSREADVARVLAGIAATRRPLRGVVHAAGVLDDGIVRQLTWERFARVLGPKVAGAWHLHRLTRELPLDWFVLFSSATALLGAPGQANHAAANAFQDALVHHRRALGLPAMTINWGPWSEIGAAARRAIGERVKTKGIGTIAPVLGWRVLARLFDAMPAQVAVIPVTWAEVPAALTAPPYFADVRTAPATATAAPEPAGGEAFAALSPVARTARLLAEVRTQVAEVLGLDGPGRVDPAQGFFTLGMDSLTSVELRNRLQTRLGRPLPSTLAFDHPTAEKAAAFLAAQFEAPVAPAATAAAAPRAADDALAGAAPIAIVGLALRFPGGADTPEKLWALLRDGVDAITEVPRERWDIDEYFDADPAAVGKISVRHGGFVHGADQFDAGFFGVSPREAMHMDPQQRLLLQTAWEALEHAGIAPEALAGTAAGVFVGISNQDYTQMLAARGLDTIDSYVGSGNAHSVAAGRLSYTLGLQGPSIAIDTACSSSLVATHLAVQSLRTGECRVALAGGVNLLLSPLISVNHSRARMLAPDGRCKTFDAAADGFIRSEGCGVVVLKRLADAERDGDRVLAVIRGSAVNQDGRTSGLTVPSGPSQQAVIRAALHQAGVTPAEVGYVEAHGTGTALGDPIELGALGAVFGSGRAADTPLRVGSIKTNLGHLESAAGVAGLIKVVLALQHDAIPPHLHFTQPNPLVAWAELPVEIPTRSLAWPAGARPRLAGVSSFGFGGTNAHLVVSEAPPTPAAAPESGGDGATLVFSARSEAALRALATRYAEFLPGTAEPWSAVCATAAVGRAQFHHRFAGSAATPAAAAALVAKFARGERGAEFASGAVGERPKVAFLFSGQGSLYAGAGRELYAANPHYRAALDECRAIVQAQAGWDVVAALESEAQLARTEFGQVALFAVEYALARVWSAWGVRSDVVAGHSVGEFAAACVAGVWPLESALTLLLARARLMGALPENGAMLAVSAGEAEVAPLLARDGVELGAINSPRQVVLTGTSAAIQAAADEAKRLGLRAQRLAVQQGYHSRQMEPMLAEFRRVADAVPFNAEPAACRFVSTVSGRVAGAELASAGYWVDQIRRPVRFGDAMTTLHAENIDLVIEIGPRGILIALGQQTWPAGAGEWLASLRPGRGERAQLTESAGRAWVRGAAVDWRAVYDGPAHGRVALPTYPFQTRRHWFEERSAPAPADAAPAYGIDWERQPLVARPVAVTGAWCLVGGDGALAAELQRRGHPLAAAPAAAERGVVFFASGADDDLPRLLATVRAVQAPAKLWLVTRHAVAVAADDAARLAPEAAIAWGAGKVIGLEHPELGATRIDLGPEVGAAALADELLGGGAEDEVALRRDGRRVARLQRRALAAGAFRARPDATYLVSGGLGALGRRVAEWLAGCGARHLLLIGRSAPSADAEAMFARLRANGVTVNVRAVDVADRAAMRAVIAECGAALPALRGVFHAAGVAGYQVLESLDAAACAAVLRPKVAGARVLDELTAELPLDAFVLFSSIAAVWGSKGQAHYAAANCFLDALAERRRALGRPALSVSWGPWAGGGMATPAAQALLAAAGVRLLAPSAALAALGRALAGGVAHVAVAEIDWPVFRAVFEVRGARPLLARMPGAATEADGAAVAAAGPALAGELRALDAAAREPRLRAHVLAVLARVLKLPEGERPDPRQGFADQGVDSLMAVELKNRLGADLGVALPATLVFDYPDAERLTRNLLSRLQPALAIGAAPANPAPPAPAGPARGASVADLSDAEVEALLLKKLETL
jgi:acyl transferase domain-containing protein/acyl carrier protein/ubiquinone/menaquinone biosynthesis C-methylase UbiE